MKKKLFLIISIFCITSLIICQSTTFKLDYLYKEIFADNYEILESGVKVHYYTKNNFEDEKNKILNMFLLDNYDENIAKDSIYVNGNKGNINLKIRGSLNNKKNFIEVQVIESNNRININKLQKKLYKLKDNYIENEQYFTFTKGKLIKNLDEKSRLEKLFQEKKAKEIKTIPISFGVTSMAKLKNEFQINYSICNYSSGTYLIVGTPIIFVEY